LVLSKDVPLVMMGDPTQLQQVILNLVMNAVEAMRGSEMSLLHIETKVRSAAAVITFRDSGPSVDQKVADKMFEPFFTTKPGGMGMGLAICRTIIEAHGGSLTATRSNPHGMELMIVVPLHLGAARNERGIVAAVPRRRAARKLTVPAR
jgi:C4-dicarboxylate-specific signal transduction histidine kinase